MDWSGPREAAMSNASMDGCDLTGATLGPDPVSGTVAFLVQIGAQRANFRGASLRHANLNGADLSMADLREADLTEAHLKGANLEGARLDGALVRDTDFTGVMLAGVSGFQKTVGLGHARNVLGSEGLVEDDLDAYYIASRMYRPRPPEDVANLDELLCARHQLLKTGEQGIEALEGQIRALEVSLRKRCPNPIRGVVARVELDSLIGGGAFATIWGGRDIDTDDRRAVKIFHDKNYGILMMLPCFRRGVRAMEILTTDPDCPTSIVPLNAAEESKLAFSMPFYEKGDLSNAGPKPILWKLAVFREVCVAVGFAHDRGIIHRDIRPPNILLDDSDRPVVADFDLVDLRAHELQSVAVSFNARAYVPPEYIEGYAVVSSGTEGDPTHGTRQGDIYSLGALLYYLIVGRDPRPPTPMMSQESWAQSLRDHFGPHIPNPLVDIIVRCMNMKEAKRYAATEDLVADLRDITNSTRLGDGLIIHRDRNEICYLGVKHRIEGRYMPVIILLAERAGTLVPLKELNELRKGDHVRGAIHALCNALEATSGKEGRELVENVRGKGYRLKPPPHGVWVVGSKDAEWWWDEDDGEAGNAESS